MTIPKATYEGMRDKERSATSMLKAEQAKVKRLELQYQDLEFQNSMHVERLSVVKAEKQRWPFKDEGERMYDVHVVFSPNAMQRYAFYWVSD